MAVLTSALANRCRDRGLVVVEMDGWLSRGESDGPFSVRGVILHHDGMGLHNNNVANYMSQDGVNGAQLWVKYDGCVWFLAAGRKWHAGTGSGWRSIPAGRGNDVCIGIETDHTFGQDWPAAQTNAIVVLTQAICAEYGIDPDQWCCGHLEYAPGRKPDPESFDLSAWRSAVKSGTSAVVTDPDGWLDMGAEQKILDAIAKVAGQVNSLYENEALPGYPYNKTAAGFNDVRDLAEKAQVTADQVSDMYSNEALPGYPYNKTAAGFNDVRAIGAALAAVAAQVTALQVAVAQITGIEVPPVVPAQGATHHVIAGDTLSKIATQYKVSVTQLVAWNKIANVDDISVGTVLLVGE